MKYFLVLSLLFIGLISTGQEYVLTGLVSDDLNPLPFANVNILELNKGVVSDEKGYFEIGGLEKGNYNVEFSYVGYKSYSQSIEIGTEKDLIINIVLKPDNVFDEVVVTGTMRSSYVSKSPIKVDVISSKKLNTYLPAASSSIIESVSLINGVQEVVACGVCFTNSISINGMDGAYTSVLIDGMPMYGNLASVYGLNGIPNMIIDRVEVIKGPSSTLYGSEAVAGVINVITKNPENQAPLSLDIMGSSHRELFANVAIAPKIGKASGFVAGNFSYIPRWEDHNQDGFSDGALMDRISLFTKWDITRTNGKKFSLAGKYYFEDRRNGVESFLSDRAYRALRGDDQIYGESIYTRRGELFGTYEFNTDFNLKLDFSGSYHLQDSYYGSDYYEAIQKVGFANLIHHFNKSDHDVLMGLTSRVNHYDDNTIATQSTDLSGQVNQPQFQFIPGVFMQDEYRISEKFTLLTGMRLDHYSNHGWIWAPRLNVKFNPSDWTTMRLNFGTGFRIVNLFTEDHAFITGQREVVITEALDPEESYNVSFNFNHIYNGLGGMGSIDVDLFYTDFQNKILPDYDDPTKIIYSNSRDETITKGIGMNWSHNLEVPLSFNIGVNLMSATQKIAGSDETEKILFASDWSGVAGVSYSIPSMGLEIGYNMNITGPMALPEVFDLDVNGNPGATSRPTTSDVFSIHNIQITKKMNTGWSLYTGLQNISNYRQAQIPIVGYNDPNNPTGFSPFFDTSYAYSPIHGREVFLGVRYDLGR
ncbi:MAG: TonB-dependent receptor [Saprospiraceae bacterium]|nr:TonB-dependent receptor [Saprospiraceae bacterium]